MSTQKKTQKRPTKVSDFKKKAGGTFELPSGAVMKLRNPGGMQAIVTAGILPNSLMAIVDKALKKGEPMKGDEVMTMDGGIDPTMLRDMQKLMDDLVVMCAVEPRVHPAPENWDDRDDELLYADELEDQDKMFIFQWVSGGTTDLEQFRKRHQEGMDALGAVAEDGRNA